MTVAQAIRLPKEDISEWQSPDTVEELERELAAVPWHPVIGLGSVFEPLPSPSLGEHLLVGQAPVLRFIELSPMAFVQTVSSPIKPLNLMVSEVPGKYVIPAYYVESDILAATEVDQTSHRSDETSGLSRAARLAALAEWSANGMDLDWEHAEDIDRRGWGLSK